MYLLLCVTKLTGSIAHALLYSIVVDFAASKHMGIPGIADEGRIVVVHVEAFTTVLNVSY